MSVFGAKASIFLARPVSGAVAAVAAEPVPSLALIVEQMLDGSRLPYSDDGTIHCVAAPDGRPAPDSIRLLWAPAAPVRVPARGLAAGTLPRWCPCAAPWQNQSDS